MKTKILAVCRHEEILQTMVRLINSNEHWEGFGVSTDEEAIKVFEHNNIAVVLIGSGVDVHSQEHLTTYFRKIKPEVKVIEHYGGGSGLIFAEIFEALKS